MDQLRAMRVFARVVDEGGFAKAARALDLAPPVVTRLVAELEDHLGARLLNRSTRSLSLTEVGEQYLEKVRGVLVDIDEAEAEAGAATRELRGNVRLVCSPAIAAHQLAPQLPRFRARHPQVTVEITAPGPVETVDETFDISVFARRSAPDGDFIARRLARTEVVACASPAYLDRRGRPGHPSDLADHDIVTPPPGAMQEAAVVFYRGGGGPNSSYALKRRAHPTLATTHIDTSYAAALAGVGVTGLPSYVIAGALLDNRLERVLPAWRLFDLTLWAGMPTRRHLPARTRAFLDFLLEIFGGQDCDPWLAAAGCSTTRR